MAVAGWLLSQFSSSIQNESYRVSQGFVQQRNTVLFALKWHSIQTLTVVIECKSAKYGSSYLGKSSISTLVVNASWWTVKPVGVSCPSSRSTHLAFNLILSTTYRRSWTVDAGQLHSRKLAFVYLCEPRVKLDTVAYSAPSA